MPKVAILNDMYTEKLRHYFLCNKFMNILVLRFTSGSTFKSENKCSHFYAAHGRSFRLSTRYALILPLHYERRDYFGIILMQGFFYVQESNGDLTLDYYFSSPP